MPQGDQFEDQYTSATADLSAGGVAIAAGAPPAASTTVREFASAPSAYQTAAEPLAMAERPASKAAASRTIGLGAAALLTVGAAIGGAWLYSRWQQQRTKPVNRLKRRLIR
jgi:hypothetical protein